MLVGLGVAGGSFTIVIAAFARLVSPDRRSWAMGLATAAGSMGQFLFAPLGQSFISAYGPVTALMLLSCTLLLVPILATALTGKGDDEDTGEEDLSTRQALRAAVTHPSYLLLTCGFFVCGFHIAFISVHLPAVPQRPGVLEGPGRLGPVAHRALQRHRRLHVGHPGRQPPAAAAAQRHLPRARAGLRDVPLVLPISTASVLVFSALIGLLWLSTVPLTSGLVALMFGTRHIGMLFGVVFLSHQIGAFLGALLGGTVYERTGSYDTMWVLCILLSVFAAIVHLPIREQRATVAVAPGAA